MKESATTIFEEFPELKIVSDEEKDNNRTIKSFVLRQSPLHTFQIEAVRKYYPHFGLKYQDHPVDYNEIFGNDRPVVMEIGFGMGTTTSHIARVRDQYNYIACEVFMSGYTKLMDVAGSENIENLRLIRYNAVDVLNDMIPDGSLSGFHIFFPDPWPKKKHHKRRLIQLPFAELLTRKLRDGGYIYCVTDWEPYAEQMVEVFSQTEGLVNPYEKFCPPREWRATTRFEIKGQNKDYRINEVWFEKKSD